MKVRNGFVSNSSSSSFVLSYDKTKVTHDPVEIVEYVKNNPDSPIIIKGKELGEGEDIFELMDEQKSLIRKFPKEFIEFNKGTYTTEHYEYDENDKANHYHTYQAEEPKITAYLDTVNLYEYNEDYSNNVDDVDMSDVEEVKLPDDFLMRLDEPEIRALMDKSKEWYKIREERTNELLKKEKEETLEEAKRELAKRYNVREEDTESEMVYIDRRSCNLDYSELEDFAERYLTNEYYNYGENNDYFHLRRTRRNKEKPFAIIYGDAITDKQNIVDYLLDKYDGEKGDAYICWTNPVYNSLYENQIIDYDYYQVGLKELGILIKNKEKFLANTRECVLFTNAEMVLDATSTISTNNKKISLGYGRIVVIPTENNSPDFKKNVTKSTAYGD